MSRPVINVMVLHEKALILYCISYKRCGGEDKASAPTLRLMNSAMWWSLVYVIFSYLPYMKIRMASIYLKERIIKELLIFLLVFNHQ